MSEHLHGHGLGHGHGHGHEHQHGVDDEHDDGPLVPLEENPLWQQDNVVLHSVGVDIGSSGTQVAFSRLHLRRLAEELTSRYVVVHRDNHFQSEVALTPYAADQQIDAVALGGLLDRAYADARVAPEEIDTGVVILTGEALRRRNAETIASVVSTRAGDLVCASAGHHMEALLAAFGSGAVAASHRDGLRLLNVDIGGGTTKLSRVESGRVVATAAFHVGGRLVATDAGEVVRLEPGGARHAERAGHALELGARADQLILDDVADTMAAALVAALRGEPVPERLWLTEPIGSPDELDGIVFSGGVAEYFYGTESREFGDLGPRLAERLRAAADAGLLPAPVLPAAARIRATVLGASEYTVQLSGITCYLSAPERTLPRRNLPVARPYYELGEVVDVAGVAGEIRRHVARFGSPDADLALALPWSGDPEYARLRGLAEAIVLGLSDRLRDGHPVYVMLDGDAARLVGRLLREELGVTNDLVVLDGLQLRDFDFVDLGRVRQPSGTVPVTIKSLVFDAYAVPTGAG